MLSDSGSARCICISVCAVALLVFAADALRADDKTALRQLTSDFLRTVQTAAEGEPEQAAIDAARHAIEYWLPAIGEDAPDWARRIEFEWNIQDDDKPEFSILTVQPLFESENKRDTAFVQFRAAREFTFGTHRTTTNAGFGYRRLLWNNRLLVGANAFFDHEWNNRHSRIGVGAEARWSGFDLYANYYGALSGVRTIGSDVFERALDGYDFELTAQIPHLPWARVRGKYLHYDSQDVGNNVDGFSTSIELDLHQNVQFEVGFSDDDVTRDGFWFAQLRFRSGASKSPVLASNRLVDDQPFRWRDMRDHTLDKVRRSNTILLERTVGGSVTISRGL